MRIPLDKTRIHDLGDFVARFYITKKENKSFNSVFVDCRRRHYKTKLTGAARLYFVVSGGGHFIIDGKKQNARLYDLFIINDGQIYEYSGKMKLIEVNVPATGPANEVRLE